MFIDLEHNFNTAPIPGGTGASDEIESQSIPYSKAKCIGIEIHILGEIDRVKPDILSHH